MLTSHELAKQRMLALANLKIGDRVKKVTGDYQITGEVRSIFTTSAGATRVAVEHKAEGGGSFLHIYSLHNLELCKEKKEEVQ